MTTLAAASKQIEKRPSTHPGQQLAVPGAENPEQFEPATQLPVAIV